MAQALRSGHFRLYLLVQLFLFVVSLKQRLVPVCHCLGVLAEVQARAGLDPSSADGAGFVPLRHDILVLSSDGGLKHRHGSNVHVLSSLFSVLGGDF